jgi:hypothetical protein
VQKTKRRRIYVIKRKENNDPPQAAVHGGLRELTRGKNLKNSIKKSSKKSIRTIIGKKA